MNMMANRNISYANHADTSPLVSILRSILIGLLAGLCLLGIMKVGSLLDARKLGQLSMPVPASEQASLAYMTSVIEVEDREHAIKKHGREAAQIRDCLNNGGQVAAWQMTSRRHPNTYIQMCRLLDGRFGIRFIQLTRLKGWVEKSSFIVKDGSLFATIEYVSARAIEFTGNLVELGR